MISACLFSTPHKCSSSSSSEMPQNLITCIYQAQLCNSPTYLTLTWFKSLLSHSLTIHAPEFFSITISLHSAPTFPFFFFLRSLPGSKSVYLTDQGRHNCQKVKLFWDFTKAEFSQNSAEPESNFYIAITCNSRVEFFLGDLLDDFTRRSGLRGFVTRYSGDYSGALLSRREHVFGRRNYVTTAEFMGSKHEFAIECSGGTLKVKIDGETRLVVKRLAWKFRGNERIVIGGVEVEFYWDVFNWVNKSCNIQKNGNGNGHGHGVFVFQIGDGAGVWPEMVGAEKKLMRKSLSSSAGVSGRHAPAMMSSMSLPTSPSCSSVLQWAEESSDCGRSSCSSTRSFGSGGGFSLFLYAWRKD